MNNEELYNRIDADEEMSDSETRETYFSEVDDLDAQEQDHDDGYY